MGRMGRAGVVNILTEIIMSTDIAGEEAALKSLDGRKSQPFDLNTDGQDSFSWEQWYKWLWQEKLRSREDDSR